MNAPNRYKSNPLLGNGPTVLWAMNAGGILWIVYGYFRFMTPQGPDVEWREELGYSPILSTELCSWMTRTRSSPSRMMSS